MKSTDSSSRPTSLLARLIIWKNRLSFLHCDFTIVNFMHIHKKRKFMIDKLVASFPLIFPCDHVQIWLKRIEIKLDFSGIDYLTDATFTASRSSWYLQEFSVDQGTTGDSHLHPHVHQTLDTRVIDQTIEKDADNKNRTPNVRLWHRYGIFVAEVSHQLDQNYWSWRSGIGHFQTTFLHFHIISNVIEGYYGYRWHFQMDVT